MGISNGGGTSPGVLLESLVKAANMDTSKSIKLLKMAMTADAEMVSTLMQSVPQHDGKLDIAA